MTKEQLEKEAENYAEQCYGWTNNDLALDVAKATYITSAEPREKQIEKLEETIANLKEQVQLQVEATIELDKENAELKSELSKKADTNHSLVEQMAKLEEENAELKSEKGCETCTKFDEIKLTKAKEHIENLLYYVRQCTCERSNYAEMDEDIKQAEQYLKEIEK